MPLLVDSGSWPILSFAGPTWRPSALLLSPHRDRGLRKVTPTEVTATSVTAPLWPEVECILA